VRLCRLVLTATCHGLDAELVIYMGLGGTLFTG
jgi:hypothetical protein